jgi:hypothetical protein
MDNIKRKAFGIAGTASDTIYAEDTTRGIHLVIRFVDPGWTIYHNLYLFFDARPNQPASYWLVAQNVLCTFEMTNIYNPISGNMRGAVYDFDHPSDTHKFYVQFSKVPFYW